MSQPSEPRHPDVIIGTEMQSALGFTLHDATDGNSYRVDANTSDAEIATPAEVQLWIYCTQLHRRLLAASEPSTHGGENISGHTEEVAPKGDNQ